MKTGQSHAFHLLFGPLIAAVFAITVFVVLIFAANSYGNISDNAAVNMDQQISLAYLGAKMHRGDQKDQVYIGEFGQIQALYIDEMMEDVLYHTVIYAYDGWIRELFFEDGLSFTPADGTPLLQAAALHFSYMEEQLLCVEYQDQQQQRQQLYLHLRSGREATL